MVAAKDVVVGVQRNESEAPPQRVVDQGDGPIGRVHGADETDVSRNF